MTVKKAIQGLDILIPNKKKVQAGILDPTQPWNKNNDLVNAMAKFMADGLQNDLDWLIALKRQLLPHQHLTKIVCTHPKKDHDIADGQKYCMNCNKDL